MQWQFCDEGKIREPILKNMSNSMLVGEHTKSYIN